MGPGRREVGGQMSGVSPFGPTGHQSLALARAVHHDDTTGTTGRDLLQRAIEVAATTEIRRCPAEEERPKAVVCRLGGHGEDNE